MKKGVIVGNIEAPWVTECVTRGTRKLNLAFIVKCGGHAAVRCVLGNITRPFGEWNIVALRTFIHGEENRVWIR